MSKSRRPKPLRIAAPPVMPGAAFSTACKILRSTESMFRQRMIADKLPDQQQVLENNADGCDLAIREVVAFTTAYEQWIAMVLPLCSISSRGQMKKSEIPFHAEEAGKGNAIVRPVAYITEDMFFHNADGDRIDIPSGIYYSDGRVTPLTNPQKNDHGEEEAAEGQEDDVAGAAPSGPATCELRTEIRRLRRELAAAGKVAEKDRATINGLSDLCKTTENERDAGRAVIKGYEAFVAAARARIENLLQTCMGIRDALGIRIRVQPLTDVELHDLMNSGQPTFEPWNQSTIERELVEPKKASHRAILSIERLAMGILRSFNNYDECDQAKGCDDVPGPGLPHPYGRAARR